MSLKALGISRFRQIAAWDDDDVERIARAMNIKPTRITKRDWRKAAALLAAGPDQPA